MEVRLTTPPLVLAIAIGFGFWILLQLLERVVWVLVLVLLALILAATLMPIVNFMRRARLPPGGWRIPKALAVVIIYLVVAVLLALLGYSAGGPFIEQLIRFVETVPQLMEGVINRLAEFQQTFVIPDVMPAPENLASQIQQGTAQIVTTLRSIIEGAVDFFIRLFIVLTLALFLVVESERILTFWVSLFPPSKRNQVRHLTEGVGSQIGRWVLGQMAVATITGILAGIVAALLGLPYPILIGVATAVLDLAPVVGPTLMVIPVFLLGLTQSLLIAILGAILFVALAQFDGNVLQPLITGRAVRLSPTLIIIAVPLGLALYGPIGALIAIPVTAALQVITTQVFLPWLREQQSLPPEAPEPEKPTSNKTVELEEA